MCVAAGVSRKSGYTSVCAARVQRLEDARGAVLWMGISCHALPSALAPPACVPSCLSRALPVSCLCSERSSSALLPSLLPCMPLWAHPTLGAVMICMALAAIGNGLLWPLSRRAGPWLVSHHCVPRAANGLGTQQAVRTLCGMHVSTSEGPVKDEPLHFSLLTAAPQPEPSLYSETSLSTWSPG